MTVYTRMNDYSFVNQYTLEQFEEQFPNSEALYIKGKTMVSIPGAPKQVPLKLLCDRFVELTENRTGWSQAQEKTAAIVGKHFESFYRKGYWEYVEGLPCCISWMCDFSISFLCCDCPPGSILETINVGNALYRKLIAQDPDIFKKHEDNENP